MIREYRHQDLEEIMQLWLETNISSHHFIDQSYWYDNYQIVKTMLPNATIYVYEEMTIVKGFIGIMDNYIAGIFVADAFQSTGIGKKLLNYVKTQNDILLLNVYEENKRAVQFYLREDFLITSKNIDVNTQALQYEMRWSKH